MTGSALDIPFDVWDLIISKFDEDRHLQLPTLSLVCKFLCSITSRYNQTLRIFGPTSHSLSYFLRRSPKLKHVSLSNFSGDVVPVLHQIAEFDFPLETLDLSNQARLPIEALQGFPSSIRTLKISSFLTDCDLVMIGNFFPNLQELDLSHPCSDDDDYEYISRDSKGWSKPTGVGISMLASKLNGSLRRINLKGNGWVFDKAVISISLKCPNLEEIVVKGCPKVTHKGISFALKTCKNLKKIELHRMRFTPDQISKPLSCSLNLSNIVFSNTVVSDELLQAIVEAKLPLKSFSLINPKRVTNNGLLSFLETYDSLEHFCLVRLYVIWGMGELSESLTKLRSIKLRQCGYGRYELGDPTLLTLIEQCPLLETVDMTHFCKMVGNKVSTFMMERNAEIRTLDLSFNSKLSDEYLDVIVVACPNLERLQLRGCPGISNKGVGEILRNCHSLKHLMMDECSGVKSLGIETDENQQLKLEFLGASSSGFNDHALIDIAEKCPLLEFLILKNCKGLRSKGVMEVLNKCTKLKEINLEGCQNVSRSSLPRLVVHGCYECRIISL